MQIAVIGAGPCGMSCAYGLLKKGHQVDIYERESTVGGLARSVNIWGKNVELGPHFLSSVMDVEVEKMMGALINETGFFTYRRLSRIHTGGRLIPYPPAPLDLLRFLGIRNAAAAFASFFKAYTRKKSGAIPADFESYIQECLGAFIYQRFFKDYTEKLWQLPCADISSDYARSLIGLGDLDLSALLRKLLPAGNRKKHRDCLYPKEGMSALWTALQTAIEQHGGRFHFGHAVRNIREEPDGGLTLEADERLHHYDYMVSTIPEAGVMNMLHDKPPPDIMQAAGSLQFRNVVFVFLRVGRTTFMADNTLYLHNRSTRCVRITNYNRFRNEPHNDLLLLEYWLDDEDALWRGSDQCLQQRAQQDLALLPGGSDVQVCDTRIIRLAKAIPVPSLHNQQERAKIAAYLSRYKRLLRIGRANQGQFNYGMEDALKEGLRCARENF